MSAIFWISFALLVYVYAGYPLLTWVRATIHPRLRCRDACEPSVSVVVVAYDEEDRIGRRIENLLALEYPRDRMEIMVATDGSTDRTVERAREYESRGVTVRSFAVRRGKAAVLDDVVPSAHGEIVVLADARQRFAPNAIRALVRNFADLAVGAVSGELMLSAARDGAAVGEGSSFYWKYEKFI